jgi:hypothetical protein
METVASLDHPFEILVALGTKPFDEGGGVDTVRFVLGTGGPHNVTVATPGYDSDVFAVTDNGGSPATYSTTLDAAGPVQEVIVS